MSNAFCGIGQIPKGKKRGSMKDCAELGQIRYYGLKKIDQRLVDNALGNKKIKGTASDKLGAKLQELMLELVTVGGRIKKLSGQIQAEKNKTDPLTCILSLINQDSSKISDDPLEWAYANKYGGGPGKDEENYVFIKKISHLNKDSQWWYDKELELRKSEYLRDKLSRKFS